jgi:hypothetical protein
MQAPQPERESLGAVLGVGVPCFVLCHSLLFIPPPPPTTRHNLIRRESYFVFQISSGLYSVTSLRKTGGEETVYAKHQELKQASKSLVASRYRSNRRCPGRGRRPRPRPLPLPCLPLPRPPPRRRRRHTRLLFLARGRVLFLGSPLSSSAFPSSSLASHSAFPSSWCLLFVFAWSDTDPWRGPLAVLNGRTDDVSFLGAYFCRGCRGCRLSLTR